MITTSFLASTSLRRLAGVGALMLAAGLPTAANAELVPSLLSVTPEGGQFRWSYNLQLSAGERLDPSGAVPNVPTTGPANVPTVAFKDYFTILDFAGFVAGSQQATGAASGWTFLSRNTGPTGGSVLVTDNASIPNLTWYWDGSSSLGPGPTNLGTFSALSTFNTPFSGAFTSDSTRNVPGNPPDGTSIQTVGGLSVPSVSAVPEPSAAWLVFAGGIGLVGLLRRANGKRRTQ